MNARNSVVEEKSKIRSVDRSRDPFFFGMSLFFLSIVLIAFTRSFYLQTYFEFPALPVHLVIHGIVLTTWFVFASVQPLLIRIRLPQVHRRAGFSGLFLAVSVVATGVWTVTMRDAPIIDEYPTRAAGNLGSLFMFLFCVILGYRYRRKPEHHKRLMLMASIPLLAPALDRVGRIPSFNEVLEKLLYWFPAPPEVAFAFMSFLTLLVVVVIRDFICDRRIHPGTAWALAAILIASPLAAAIIVGSGAWIVFVKWAA